MCKILVSWIGHADLRAPKESEAVGVGPVAQAVDARAYDHVFLLTDHEDDVVHRYIPWIVERNHKCRFHVLVEGLSSPTAFGEIYAAAVRGCETALRESANDASLTFHLSPGTPAMAAVWIILAKTRFPAELIESSRQHGVRTAAVPFDISAEYVPDLLRRPDRKLERLTAGLSPDAAEFDQIIHRSPVMKRVIARARRVAPRSVPVLVEGETGTGKELMARAIHQASPRQGRPFIAVNCGAIPPDLVESELFGHEKGAFTGADRLRKGYFEAADTGTLFLDEIGELSAPAQVKLLRILQDGQVVRIGATRPVQVDVRVIAATNRTLTHEVAQNRFREDLFYRLAVAILKLPPLRQRPGDLGLLIDRLLEKVNEESASEPNYKEKRLSPAAKNVLLQHSWPGNVRELSNTLRRAAIWSGSQTLEAEDLRDALLPARQERGGEGVLDHALGDGFSLPGLLADVAHHYLTRAMGEAAGNKTKAARLVGLSSYQTLTNWLSKYSVER